MEALKEVSRLGRTNNRGCKYMRCVNLGRGDIFVVKREWTQPVRL